MAASACYSPAELQAEHLLRLHSELMVITVTCQQGSQGENLVPAYSGFTNSHIGPLHQAELTLIRYFNSHGGGGTDRLDKLRTKLGNEFGQKIADMSAPAYCAQFRDKVLAFNQATESQLHDEVQRMEVADKSYVKPCGTTHIAEK